MHECIHSKCTTNMANQHSEMLQGLLAMTVTVSSLQTKKKTSTNTCRVLLELDSNMNYYPKKRFIKSHRKPSFNIPSDYFLTVL